MRGYRYVSAEPDSGSYLECDVCSALVPNNVPAAQRHALFHEGLGAEVREIGEKLVAIDELAETLRDRISALRDRA